MIILINRIVSFKNHRISNFFIIVKVLYVFVEIKFEHHHLVEIIKKNFPADSELYLLGTVQFIGMVHAAGILNVDIHTYILRVSFRRIYIYIYAHSEGADLRETMSNIKIPQEKPLSAGTAPDLA